MTKRVFRLEEPVDPGLVAWAGEYLGTARRRAARLAKRAARARGAGARARERAFLALIGQTLLEVGAEAGPEVLSAEPQGSSAAPARRSGRPRCGSSSCSSAAAVLELVSEALEPQRAVVHVGPEVGGAELHSVSLVGATYGIRSRPLGAVGLVGPLRMDYEKAIRSVRAAAFELSRFVEDVYEDA